MTRQVDISAQRVYAWVKGQPIARYSTKHVYCAPPGETLALAFIRMGGESAPWGIAWGRPDENGEHLTVPEPRNRDLVAEMVAEFAPALLDHFAHPDYFQANGPADLPYRQLWLPNATHLDMLHHLEYSYAFAKWGPPARAKRLRAVGRLSGWLFREAHRPGQQTVMVATDVLKSMFVFPSDPVREAHLGYLLAWLSTKGKRSTRMEAAKLAESRSIATTLNPAVERDHLDPLVEKWNDAKEKQPRVASKVRRKISEVLVPELERRFKLTVQARQVLIDSEQDTNAGVCVLRNESRTEHWYQYVRMARKQNADPDGPAFVPSPETDRYPAAAASRYFVTQGSEELRITSLIHHDAVLQEESINAGDAIKGQIVEVWDEGEGKRTVPVWRVQCPHTGTLRIREGTDLCVAGLPSRTISIRKLNWIAPDLVELEVEVVGLKTIPRNNSDSSINAAADPAYSGKTVSLLPISRSFLSRQKMQKVWNGKVPGGWLTHASPTERASVLPPEIADDIAVLARVTV